MFLQISWNTVTTLLLQFLIDKKHPNCYNLGMKIELNDVLQWSGAALIIAGHSLNAIGPAVYPYNILTFLLGTVMFLVWALRVGNRPQITVNVVSVAIGITGMIRAFG